MDRHDSRHELTSDHDHPNPLEVGLRRVGWAHNHVADLGTSRVGRSGELDNTSADDYSLLHITGAGPSVLYNEPGTAAVVVRTVAAWDNGELIRPCQFGSHGNMKYNVVQLHHKDPVGLGGPNVKLDYEEDCGWERGLRGLGACGLHHDDVHLLWRMAIKSGQSAAAVLKVERLWRGMFGRKVIHAVEHGWLDRMSRTNLALLEGDVNANV